MENSRMGKTWFYLVFVGFGVAILLLCGGIFSVVYMTFNTSGCCFGGSEDTIQSYRYLKVNPLTDEQESGIVSLGTDRFGHDEYKSFEDFEGNHHLISKFGDQQYQCTGSCYCDDYRRNSAVLGRGLFYLLSAGAAGYVWGVASNHFEEQCAMEFSHHCGGKVTSSVDSCDEVADSASDGDTKRYMCEMWCAPALASVHGDETHKHCQGTDVSGKNMEEVCAKIRKRSEIVVGNCQGMNRDDCLDKAKDLFRNSNEAMMTKLCTYDDEKDDFIDCRYNPTGNLECVLIS